MQAQTGSRIRQIRQPRRPALAGLAGMILACRAFAGSVTLYPNADTSLFANFPDNDLGASSSLVSGVNGSGFSSRALVRFDVANQIPSNAVIQSVALTMNVVTVPGGGGVASVFDLRRVLLGWGEGAGTSNTGSPANAGEATWNNRMHPSTPWTVPGGAISNDFSETLSASMLISGLGSYTFNSTTQLVADVQQWLLNPSANFGWVLISESENTAFTARRFGSREDAVNTPVLVVEYAVPATTQIQWIKAVGAQIQFSFSASAEQPYTVQYRDSLSSGNWLTLTNIAPQTTSTNLIVTDPFPTNVQRFYRIGVF